MAGAEQRTLDEFDAEADTNAAVDVDADDLETALGLVDIIMERGHDDLARLEAASGDGAFSDEAWDELDFTDRVIKLGTRLHRTTDSLTVDHQNLRSEYGIE